MTLSTSRQQFLSHDTHPVEDEIEYNRKGGVFISHCVCFTLVVIAVVVATLVGIIVYFVTFHKLTQKPEEFWNVPDNQALVATGVRLPPDVVPSFYRLKIRADLEKFNFTGDVYITIKASKKVKEIVLHSKHLVIENNAKLTEQIYEKVETLQGRSKRDVAEESTISPPIETKNETNSTSETSTISSNTENTTEIAADAANTTEVNLNNTITTESTLNTTSETSTVTEKAENETRRQASPKANDDHFNLDTQVTHSSVRNIKIISITTASGDRLILTLATALKPNVDYTLELSFRGNMSDGMNGFYKSIYKNEKQENRTIAVTQFEPTAARSAFPCFDEPAFKAQFEISIAHRQNLTVLSNMKISTQEPIVDQAGWQWTHFERSVKMSTYLVAYVICDFESLEASYVSKDNVTKAVKVWVRPEFLNKARYALKITPKLLEYYEDLFGVPYALDKVDLIGIPDFSSGAMENWGLVTLREPFFLVDEATSTVRERMQVGIAVAHELGHQWFGNLVTMRWWTDLWLNEGFATYIENVGFDHVEPELHMLEQFTRDKMDLLRSDSLRSTLAVSRAVTDGSEIAQKFNDISYQKGANLIRMLNHTISETLFRKGLVHYLKKWQYSNAEENDLWAAMSTMTQTDPSLKDRSIVAFMNTWTRQAGYPVVNVVRDYEAGNVRFEQRLFTVSSEPSASMLKQVWQIPISYASATASDGSTQPRLWLTEKEVTAAVAVPKDQALYVNVDAIGYYRVNYDQKNWEMLSKALKSGQVTSAIIRAQLIDDAFNLAKASLVSYNEALSLTTYAINGEDSKAVWDTILTNMGFLKTSLASTTGYTKFQDFVRLLIAKQLAKLKYGLEKPHDDNESLLVEGLVSWDCAMESPRCRDWATHEFNVWMNTDGSANPIPAHLRLTVYDTALRYGGRREFEFVLSRFHNATDPSGKERLIASLPSVRDEALITRLLESSLSEEIPKQYASAVWTTAPPFAARVARNFLYRNFERVYETFNRMDEFMFRSILEGTFDAVNTQADLDQLVAFARQHATALKPMSQSIARLVDAASLRVRWFDAHATTVTRWLDSFLTNYTHPATEATSIETPALRSANDTLTPLAIETTTVEATPAASQPLDNTTTTSSPDKVDTTSKVN